MKRNLMSPTWYVQTNNNTTAQYISNETTQGQMQLLNINCENGNLNKNSPVYYQRIFKGWTPAVPGQQQEMIQEKIKKLRN